MLHKHAVYMITADEVPFRVAFEASSPEPDT